MSERTQTCDCGNETYNIKWTLSNDPEIWAECADCGRPTRTVGNTDKQQEWLNKVEQAEEGDTILFDEPNDYVENLSESENDG